MQSRAGKLGCVFLGLGLVVGTAWVVLMQVNDSRIRERQRLGQKSGLAADVATSVLVLGGALALPAFWLAGLISGVVGWRGNAGKVAVVLNSLALLGYAVWFLFILNWGWG
jgi:hypothetical protein